MIEEMIDRTTEIKTINLVLQSAFSNLFQSFDIKLNFHKIKEII